MRTISSILADALANQKGELILRVLTWSDQADYNAHPTTPDHTWIVKAFDIYSTSANAELVTENDYIASAFTVFIIERGVKIEGMEYTVKSGLFFVKKYKEGFGNIKIEGSSYPNQKISIAAGDGTYQEVIEAFCAMIGKTAVFKNTADQWLSYQFLPDGKSLSLNKAEQFENLLKQKYTILVYEESPNNLVFYTQDSYKKNYPYAIAWSPELGLFCAVSELGGNEVLTSPNGMDWTNRTPAEVNYWYSITWSPELGLFCAVATNGTHQVMTSPNGIDWTPRTAAEANNWASITWSPSLGLFCAVAYSGTHRVMTSPNGMDWTARTAAEASSWVSIVWSPSLGLFCAIAQSGTHRVMTSPDGINWTARTAAEAKSWSAITWSPSLGLFCVVALGSNRVMTSPDGVNWTARTATEANAWSAIAWSPELGLFCAVAFSGVHRVMTSPNGINWTARTAAAANSWDGIVWSPQLGVFCAVAEIGDRLIMTSPNGIDWTIRSGDADFSLTYTDGPTSYLIRDQSAVHYLWRDENASLHTQGDTSLPQWNLGFLASTDSPPATHEDAYYKIFLQKAPVRLDITDGDKIHFRPYWSIDPTKTIDAMMQVSEHLDLKRSPSWFQEIRSIIMFNSTEGGALPSTIERVAAYTPLVSTGFDGNLDPSVNNLQALAQAVDDMPLGSAPATTAANDFQVGNGSGSWITKTLAQTKTILGILADAASDSVYYVRRNAGWTNLKTYTDTLYSVLSHTHSGLVTNGDSHDHNGGDGGQINHTGLSNVGSNTHAQIDAALAAKYDVFGGTTVAPTTTVVAATATSYLLPFFNGFSTGGGWPVPASCVIDAMYFRINATTGNGTLVFTLQDELSDTALTLSLPAGSVSNTYGVTGTPITITAGHIIRVKVVNNSTNIASPIITGWSLRVKY